MQDKHTSEKMCELVKKHFPKSNCTPADIGWNRAYLRGKGIKVPDTIREKAEAAE